AAPVVAVGLEELCGVAGAVERLDPAEAAFERGYRRARARRPALDRHADPLAEFVDPRRGRGITPGHRRVERDTGPAARGGAIRQHGEAAIRRRAVEPDRFEPR